MQKSEVDIDVVVSLRAENCPGRRVGGRGPIFSWPSAARSQPQCAAPWAAACLPVAPHAHEWMREALREEPRSREKPQVRETPRARAPPAQAGDLELSPCLIRDSRIQVSGAENAVRGFRAGLARIWRGLARILSQRHGSGVEARIRRKTQARRHRFGGD